MEESSVGRSHPPLSGEPGGLGQLWDTGGEVGRP
jgi:hypothetical protein